MDVVRWYVGCLADSETLPAEAAYHWESFANFLKEQTQGDTLQRDITLIAVDNDTWLAHSHHIEWDDGIHLLAAPYRSIEGFSRHYNLREVTGVDFCVQGRLVMQHKVVFVLWTAVQKIIRDPHIRTFAFACLGGTHRSVGCCLLLASLVFPRARICLTSDRTRRSAMSGGLIGIS